MHTASSFVPSGQRCGGEKSRRGTLSSPGIGVPSSEQDSDSLRMKVPGGGGGNGRGVSEERLSGIASIKLASVGFLGR